MSSVPPPDFNPYAVSGCDVVSKAVGIQNEFSGYAGFWRRFGAWLIDGVVTGLITVLLGMMSSFFFSFMGGFLLRTRWGYSGWGNVSEDNVVHISVLMGAVVGVSATVVYCAWMESSALQATLGKLALGVKVTDLQCRRISFGRALLRFASKIVSFLLLSVGFIMAAFTEKRQGLHDKIGGTLVMKIR